MASISGVGSGTDSGELPPHEAIVTINKAHQIVIRTLRPTPIKIITPLEAIEFIISEPIAIDKIYDRGVV